MLKKHYKERKGTIDCLSPEKKYGWLKSDSTSYIFYAYYKEGKTLHHINQGEKVEHVFTLKNEGKNDLIIRKVKTSCGCTAVKPEKDIVAKGESTPLKVVFNSRGKSGRQNKSITVTTNDPKNHSTILWIKGNVKKPTDQE